MSDTLWQSTLCEVQGLLPLNERDAQSRSDAVGAIETDAESSLRKDATSTHFTASAFVFDQKLEWVALCYHRKGQFWVQPGGHLEPGDDSIEGAAMRELREETGVLVGDVRIVGTLDLDSHALGDGFGRCARHLDFGVAALLRAVDLPELSLSDESEELIWAQVAELPENCAPGLAERIRFMCERVSAA